jgi:protein involved in sex pheromone biosynthesis
MKRIILATAAALTLTACATNQDAYYNAIAAREARQAEQELRADTAIAQMAASGDAQAKGMAIMHFAMKASNAKQSQQAIAAPKSVADQLLPWASLIVPSITQFYSITKNAEIAINSSDNALVGKKADNKMITDLVQGREAPIVGTEDDVLLYTPQ